MVILIQFGASEAFLVVLRVITHLEGAVSSGVTHQTLPCTDALVKKRRSLRNKCPTMGNWCVTAYFVTICVNFLSAVREPP